MVLDASYSRFKPINPISNIIASFKVLTYRLLVNVGELQSVRVSHPFSLQSSPPTDGLVKQVY